MSEVLQPFSGDLLQRAALAARLTPFVDQLKAGGTIGIDAPWGEGKTWFGQHWKAKLQADGHKVAYIDAFAHDFVDDPFLLVAAELSTLLQGASATSAIAKKAGGVMRSLAPLATKAVINLSGRVLMGVGNLEGEISEAVKAATEASAGKAEKWLEKAVASFEAEKRSLRAFRATLAEAVGKEEKRVVVLIDELDRCRPSFAVSMLERIKHLFDVENLVIVLLLNRDQLEKAIRGVYGEGLDGAAYLGKFVNVWFDLPIAHVGDPEVNGNNVGPFIMATLKATDDDIGAFGDDMALWAKTLRMSLRDLERSSFLFLAARASTAYVPLLAYLIALKIKRPETFRAIRVHDRETHRQCAEWLDQLVTDADRWPGRLLIILSSLHQHLIGEKLDASHQDAWNKDFRRVINSSNPERAISFLSDLIDLPLGR